MQCYRKGIPDIIGLSEVACSSDSDPEAWHVQVILPFRIFFLGSTGKSMDLIQQSNSKI